MCECSALGTLGRAKVLAKITSNFDKKSLVQNDTRRPKVRAHNRLWISSFQFFLKTSPGPYSGFLTRTIFLEKIFDPVVAGSSPVALAEQKWPQVELSLGPQSTARPERQLRRQIPGNLSLSRHRRRCQALLECRFTVAQSLDSPLCR